MAHKWSSSGICARMSALFFEENPANYTFKNSHTLSVCSQSLDIYWTFIDFLSDRKAQGTMDRSLCSGLRSRRSWRGRSISWWGQVWCLSSRGHTLHWNAALHLCCLLILPGVDDGTCRKWLWFRWHFLPALTSWCAGTVQRCQALSLFPLKMLFLPLFTGWLCV